MQPKKFPSIQFQQLKGIRGLVGMGQGRSLLTCVEAGSTAVREGLVGFQGLVRFGGFPQSPDREAHTRLGVVAPAGEGDDVVQLLRRQGVVEDPAVVRHQGLRVQGAGDGPAVVDLAGRAPGSRRGREPSNETEQILPILCSQKHSKKQCFATMLHSISFFLKQKHFPSIGLN